MDFEPVAAGVVGAAALAQRGTEPVLRAQHDAPLFLGADRLTRPQMPPGGGGAGPLRDTEYSTVAGLLGNWFYVMAADANTLNASALLRFITPGAISALVDQMGVDGFDFDTPFTGRADFDARMARHHGGLDLANLPAAYMLTHASLGDKEPPDRSSLEVLEPVLPTDDDEAWAELRRQPVRADGYRSGAVPLSASASTRGACALPSVESLEHALARCARWDAGHRAALLGVADGQPSRQYLAECAATITPVEAAKLPPAFHEPGALPSFLDPALRFVPFVAHGAQPTPVAPPRQPQPRLPPPGFSPTGGVASLFPPGHFHSKFDPWIV